jgi:hypothetical protein
MRIPILLLLLGMAGVNCVAEANDTRTISDQEYAQVSRQIQDRVMALKGSFKSMSSMTSPTHHEYNFTWVLDDPTKPHGKTNGRRAVFGKDGYWFSLQFYRGQWAGAAAFVPIEFGDLKLWFQFEHGGNTKEIEAVTAILREENGAFSRRYPWQTPNQGLLNTVGKRASTQP